MIESDAAVRDTLSILFAFQPGQFLTRFGAHKQEGVGRGYDYGSTLDY